MKTIAFTTFKHSGEKVQYVAKYEPAEMSEMFTRSELETLEQGNVVIRNEGSWRETHIVNLLAFFNAKHTG